MCEYEYDPEFINSHTTICHQRIQKGLSHIWHNRELSEPSSHKLALDIM